MVAITAFEWQVRVIFISKTGERATPFIRQTAKNYRSFATFAFALWKEEESTFWWNMFGVESAPAIVFLKDPGVEPVVYHGSINSSAFTDIMEKNKYHVLPQLRNVTAKDLGCDVHGYSRAGNDIKIWYCAIVAGRPSQELNQMRKTMRRVQEKLSNDEETDLVDQEPMSAPAAVALKEKRLTFAWLDGETQHRYCLFHIHSEHSYETCGPRRGITDAPQLFIVRYERNDTTTDERTETKKEPKNVFQAWHHTEVDPVSTLVAKYNGSSEIPEIIRWISQIIKDGDSRELPPFKTSAPELVPEDADWSHGSQRLISSGKNMKQWTSGFVSQISNNLGDPRIGPSLLLGALMSFGLIWLNRNRSTQSSQLKDEHDQPSRRNRGRSGLNQLIPPSITDMEPRDAQQMPLLDSDSE
ncbi:hypothetical protein ACJIZ3_014273 [Penstemon smallii]|uniref:Uncharacterized protein n=1 Tax=Penstemon smallii TaxID=265156 RepID=A0ABD3RJ25_9LAMI